MTDVPKFIDRLLAALSARCPGCTFRYAGIAPDDIVEEYMRNEYPEAYRMLPVHIVEGEGTQAPSVVREARSYWSGRRSWRINEHYLRTQFDAVVDNIADDSRGDVRLSDRVCY